MTIMKLFRCPLQQAQVAHSILHRTHSLVLASAGPSSRPRLPEHNTPMESRACGIGEGANAPEGVRPHRTARLYLNTDDVAVRRLDDDADLLGRPSYGSAAAA